MKKFFSFAAGLLFAAAAMAQPTSAPATPAQDASQVLSLYCTNYDIIMAPKGWGGGWEAIQVEGTDVLYFATATWDCIGDDEKMPVNATGFEYLHIDAWCSANDTVAFTLESKDNVEPKTKCAGNVLKANEWVSFDLKMEEAFPGVTGQAINFFIYENFSGEQAKDQLALANIYFHHGVVSAVENVAAEKAQKMVVDGQIVIVKNGERYNVLGTKL